MANRYCKNIEKSIKLHIAKAIAQEVQEHTEKGCKQKSTKSTTKRLELSAKGFDPFTSR